MLARRGLSGQLVVESEGATYRIVLDHGHVVAAISAVSTDCAASVGLAHGVISSSQAEVIGRWLTADPHANEFAVCANVAGLSLDELQRLRRRTIAQRAARVFALQRGDYVLDSAISLQVEIDTEMHVGGVIYHAGLAYLDEWRLRAILCQLGSRFQLRADAIPELPYFGFDARERAFLRRLSAGVQLAELHAIAHEHERRIALASVYALASCGAVYCEATTPAPRFARGTQDPLHGRVTPGPRRTVPSIAAPRPRTTTLPQASLVAPTAPRPTARRATLAAEAYRRGQAALQADRAGEAVAELERATELAPADLSYAATLAWARFCGASDKLEVATETRRALRRAILYGEAPVTPHYYLGVVERILGRADRALKHFYDVLSLDPNHTEAATEIRFLRR